MRSCGGAHRTFVLRFLQRSQLTAVRFFRTFCLLFLGPGKAASEPCCAVGMAADAMLPRGKEVGKREIARYREVDNAGKLMQGSCVDPRH